MKTPLAVLRARLRQQRLAAAPPATPSEVVRWMGAMQAQERTIAKWSVGQRAPGLDQRDVDRALAAGEIVRTHALRPTWHFVTREDLRWIVALTAPRVHALNAVYYRRVGVDDALAARGRAVFERALDAEGPLTRTELAERLARHRIDADDMRLGYILMRAELDLVICGGPPRGKQHTYVLVEQHVGSAPPLDRDEALAELALRYFQSHGPASLKDFVWWSSLRVADARRSIEAAAIDPLRIGDRDFWWVPPATLARDTRGPAAHLLQGYDEYLVAYRDTRDLLGSAPSDGSPRATPAFLHAVVIDGRGAGSWRAVGAAKDLIIEVRLGHRPNERERRAVAAAVERYGRFLGRPARLNLE